MRDETQADRARRTTPFIVPDARGFSSNGGSLADLPEDDRFAAIAYGVAFIERLSMELVHSIGYQTTGRSFINGGGTRNPWWNQVRANVQNRAVHLAAQSEGAYRGFVTRLHDEGWVSAALVARTSASDR